jgi:hypothetical protein
MTKEELHQELMKINVDAYDKGIDDAFNVMKEAFTTLKERGFKAFSVETVIEILETGKETAHSISTTHLTIKE